jgi:hypothetical protein
VLPVTDGTQGGELAAGREERDAGISETERRESAELFAQVERELAPVDDRVDDERRPQVVVRERRVRMVGERMRERVDAFRPKGEPCGCAMASPPDEMRSARPYGRVEIKRRDRSTRTHPLVVAARDEDDGAVEALDESRRDDPDHTAMPVFAGDDVAAPALHALGPCGDLAERVAQDPVLHALAITVERFELGGEAGRVLIAFGQEELERGSRMAKPPRRVDPRRKPECNGTRVDRARID